MALTTNRKRDFIQSKKKHRGILHNKKHRSLYAKPEPGKDLRGYELFEIYSNCSKNN